MRRPATSWLHLVVQGVGVALAAAATAASAGPAVAQQVRAIGTTTVRYIEVRPFRSDSVPVESTRGEGILRRSAEGEVVRCVVGEAFCRFLAPADPVEIAPMLQDVRLSVWGLGRGVRAYGHLRGRAVAGGGNQAWPLAGDHFDALTAYVEVDRTLFRARAGRQWKTSGLGYYNFDGVSVLLRTFEPVTFQAWVGRSLLRGASEPRTGEALAAVEPFVPDEGELLVGVEAAWRPGPGRSVSTLYQRQIRRDRKGLFAERLAVDANWRRGRLLLTGTVEADLATTALNEARLEADVRLRPTLGAAAFGRHHRPFFEAWTIWGAFAPVGFDEVGGRAWWRLAALPLTLEARGAWRSYGESNASTTFESFRNDGWHLTTAATLAPGDSWEARLRLGTDVGFGAATDDVSLRVQRTFSGGGRLAASVMAFERVFEFRVDEGTIWGAGVDGEVRLSDRVALEGRFAGYFHSTSDQTPDHDWSQLRGSLTARWSVGAAAGGTQ